MPDEFQMRVHLKRGIIRDIDEILLGIIDDDDDYSSDPIEI